MSIAIMCAEREDGEIVKLSGLVRQTGKACTRLSPLRCHSHLKCLECSTHR